MIDFRKRHFRHLSTMLGFTLPEVLIVIVIISILILIASPTYFGITEKARCINLGANQQSTLSCNDVKIIIPASNSAVPMISTFQGSFNKISLSSTSWIYVYAPWEQKYYLDRIKELDAPSKKGGERGKWSLDDVKIGGPSPSDSQQEYTVGVLVTQGSSTKMLEEQEDCLDELPLGIRLSEIRIFRQ